MTKRKWASLDLARTLGTKFKSDWRTIPIASRRAWAKRMFAGVLLSVVTLYGSILLLGVLNAGANHLAWEENALRTIESGPIGFSTAVWLQTLGSDFMLVSVVLTTMALAVWYDRPLLAVTILISMIAMDVIVRAGWLSLARSRPDIIAQGIASPRYHSFPSGHTSKTLALYGLLAAQWFQASRSRVEKLLIVLLVFLIAVSVPYGRLRMGVHWPTDVFAGLFLGGVWLSFAIPAARYDRRS